MQLFDFKIEDGERVNSKTMADIYLKKFKFGFSLIVLVLFIAFVASVFIVRDSPYFTLRYIKMNWDYLRYELVDLWKFRTVNSFLAEVSGFFEGGNFNQAPEVAKAKSVPVLLYHGVVDVPDGSNVTKEQFQNQMKFLQEAGYQTITLKDFAEFIKNKKELPIKSFLLTFDDGRKDSYYPVDPILKSLNYNAVIFLTTAHNGNEESNFYLTTKEIKQMIATGRWEVGSHGRSVHLSQKIDANGHEGYFLSNKIYLDNEDRIESDEEFKDRIKADILDSNDYLKKEFGAVPIAFSVPTGDFGENSINYKKAEEVVLDAASDIYDLIFSDIWPRAKDGFRANYIDSENSKFAKRIFVDSQWSENEIVNVLNATQETELPYKENFINDKKWLDTFGTISSKDNKLLLVGNNGSASAYLDGSRSWKDYEYAVTIGDNISNGDTISLLSRYKNAHTFVSCQFGEDSVLIKSSNQENGASVLTSIKTNHKYLLEKDTRLKMRVYGDSIQCFINNDSVAQAEMQEILFSGGIGIKLWNPEKETNTLVLSNVEVRPLEISASDLCAANGVIIKVPDGSICRDNANLSKWLNIYDTYPLSAKGKEIIYSFLDDGEISVADALLSNEYRLERFKPVNIKQPITWREDPFNDIYWRFNFYNLSYTRNLLYAWEKTGNSAYKDKLVSDLNSFIDRGMTGPYSWDYHGTAYRTMAFINAWWKLREKNELPVDLGIKILQALKLHGDFLADGTHFEKDYNHGLDQTAALYVLAVNFPDLPGAKNWYSLAVNRLKNSINQLIDTDGILIENSPYYHFYVLDKYWEINQYLKQYNLFISGEFDKKIGKMINYAAYIIQPNLKIPTIGASLERKININGVYKEIAAQNPNFLYVLTQGAEGNKPPKQNVYYPDAGETIMRSGWSKGENFENQTQLVFDVGDYRTNHSDLDALSFHLYGKGIALMPDSGLYTYDPGQYRSYFHGTRAHNTIVVDGLDQDENRSVKSVVAGVFQEGDGFSYQSGEQSLYKGVSHERAVVLIEDSVVIIIDKLSSNDEHNYEQMFHLFPGAKINTNGLTLEAAGDKPDQSLTIHQLLANNISLNSVINQTNPVDGLCSTEYKIASPCYSISYSQKGKDVSYITAIQIGQGNNSVKLSDDKNAVIVNTGSKEYQVKINELSGLPRKVDVNKNYDMTKLAADEKIIDSFDNISNWKMENESGGTGGSISSDQDLQIGEKELKIISPNDGTNINVARDISLDLSHQNLIFKLKIDNTKSLRDLRVSLSNKNWADSVSYSNFGWQYTLYPIDYDGEWVTIGLGKGEFRSPDLDNWEVGSSGFDWSKIDGIKFELNALNGDTSIVHLSYIAVVPEQNEGEIAVIFDDGWDSVVKAADIMGKYGFKGNIGIISDNVGKKLYLTLDEIQKLQNEYGWNVVNHSSFHQNAIDEYYMKNNLRGLETDVVDGLQYLIKNNINSAPDWYIYPNGAINGSIKEIIGKYYKFARSTQGAPEIFPFGDPLGVKTFMAYSDRSNALDIHNAVEDAKKYKLTLVLVFHKLSEGSPTMYTEYSVDAFEAVMKDIKDQGIKVLTLSELDKENGIPETEFKIEKEIPAQIKLEISSQRKIK